MYQRANLDRSGTYPKSGDRTPKFFDIASILFIIVLELFILFQGCASAPKTAKDAVEMDILAEDKPIVISDFILGYGDEVEITVWRNDDLHKVTKVMPDGNIYYPLVGQIKAKSMSIFELQQKITEGLSKYLVDPQVSVTVISMRTNKIFVIGEVKQPGVFPIDGPITLIEAISRAGGFNMDGNQNSVLLIRGETNTPKLVTLDLEKALKEGDFTQNATLQRGDVIYVPRTFISDVDRFFARLSNIITPLLQLETGYYIGQQIETHGGQVVVPVGR